MPGAKITVVKSAKVLAPVVMAGLIVHAPFANQLGLYRDDAWILMQGLIAADSDPMSFILSDTTGSLLKQRPFSYFAWMLARTGFTIGLATLHWMLAGLLILNAITLAAIARRILDQDWFVFVVAVIFLTYPLSPTQAIMASNIHYSIACLLALLAILFCLYGLECPAEKQLLWCALAAGSYLASLLTHEEFCLLPLAFMLVHLLFARSGRQAYLDKISAWDPLIKCLLYLSVTLLLYFSWRQLLLPLYEGNYSYLLPRYHMLLDASLIAKKVLLGADTVFMPWDRAVYQIFLFLPPIWTAGLLVILVCAIGTISFRLLSSPAGRQLNEPGLPLHQWLRPVIMGVVLIMALLVPIAFSGTTSIEAINGMRSSVNFAALVGIAVTLPALFAVMLHWAIENRVSLIAVLLVIAAGHCLVLLNDSTARAILNPHFARFIPLGVTCISAIGSVLLIIGCLARTRRLLRSNGNSEQREAGMIAIRVPAVALSGMTAFAILIGSLFQASNAYEWTVAWKQYRTMLMQLQHIAPALEDNTFVLILGDPQDKAFKNIKWRVLSGSELSVHLLALYGNWSILGHFGDKDTTEGVEFYANALNVPQEKWFRPGVKGPLITAATAPIIGVAYDRLLLFEFDQGSIRLLPEREVKTVTGERLVLTNNTNRIHSRASVAATMWHDMTR